MTDPLVRRVGERIAWHADQIKAMFLPDAKVTIFVRNPADAGQEMVITTDDLSEVVKALERRRTAADSGHDEVIAR